MRYGEWDTLSQEVQVGRGGVRLSFSNGTSGFPKDLRNSTVAVGPKPQTGLVGFLKIRVIQRLRGMYGRDENRQSLGQRRMMMPQNESGTRLKHVLNECATMMNVAPASGVHETSNPPDPTYIQTLRPRFLSPAMYSLCNKCFCRIERFAYITTTTTTTTTFIIICKHLARSLARFAPPTIINSRKLSCNGCI